MVAEVRRAGAWFRARGGVVQVLWYGASLAVVGVLLVLGLAARHWSPWVIAPAVAGLLLWCGWMLDRAVRAAVSEIDRVGGSGSWDESIKRKPPEPDI